MTKGLEPRINFITLGVRNIAASRSFYEHLGFKAHAMGNEHVAFFDVNGTVLSLFGHDALAHDAGAAGGPQPAYRGTSLAWNGRSEADVDAIMAHALACGATPLKAPQKVFWGGYSGYFADPDGHMWEVAFNPFIEIDQGGHVTMP